MGLGMDFDMVFDMDMYMNVTSALSVFWITFLSVWGWF
jgi:hypothetical protein